MTLYEQKSSPKCGTVCTVSLRVLVIILLLDVDGPSLLVVSSSWTSEESSRWFWLVTTTELST
jgi:hypothetical protein